MTDGNDEHCLYCSNRARRNAHNRFNDELEMVCEVHYAYIKPSHAKVNPVEIGRCIRCGAKSLDRRGKNERLIDHHVNYPLDLTVPICDACHRSIHNEESDDRYLEPYERGQTPFIPVGKRDETGRAIHIDYKTGGRPDKVYYCPNCATHVIYAPDGMGHESPFICPNSECDIIELGTLEAVRSKSQAESSRVADGGRP